MKKKLIIIVSIILVLSISAQTIVIASSPVRIPIPIAKNRILQVRGLDKPHGIKTYASWPGYDSFVHSNCYHLHGEYKKLSSSGRETSSKTVTLPLYCTGLSKYIKTAFETAASKVGLTPTAFLKVGTGVFFSILFNVPSVGNPGDQYTPCNQKKTTNTTACFWTK